MSLRRITNSTDGKRVDRGVTLLELLIVMTIMLMVTAAAIPMMRPALQNRQLREASRLVGTYIQGARARAIELGRPVGIALERDSGKPYCTTLSYVEVPPPYAGDTVNSRALVSGGTGGPWTITQLGQNVGQPSYAPDVTWFNVVRWGDQIRFDYKGPLFTLASQSSLPDPNVGRAIPPVAVSAANPWYAYSASGALLTLPNVTNGPGVGYQILRQPTARTSAESLQLPEGIVVDLAASGMGLSLLPFNTGTVNAPNVLVSPIFTFAPNGAMDYVLGLNSNNVYQFIRPIGPLNLLIGKRELMPDVSASAADENLYEPNPSTGKNLYLSNFWVSVGYQTGNVAVVENGTNLGPIADPTKYLHNARTFAQQAVQPTGGQ